MGNIIQYVREYGNDTFQNRAINDVDSLVFTQFAYLKFDYLVPDTDSGGQAVSILELMRHPRRSTMFADERYTQDNKALIVAMAKSKRFREVGLNYHENIIDAKKETQFSAITFFLPNKEVYVAFRGTDETIVGWKEDFNMAFSIAVPAQIMSEKYLKYVARKFEGTFYVGGHSKGGNLAVYAAMNSANEVQKRIQKIYSHDGPGFRPEVLKKMNYSKIKDRVYKFLPHSSLVGMLLQSQENYEVVQSHAIGLLQHNPYTWSVKEGDFVKSKDVYRKRKIKNEVLNKWILSLEEERLHLFVDTLYQIASACEVDTLVEFGADWLKCCMAILGAMKEMDEDTKKMIWETVKSLIEIRLEG